jgi:RNA polymerase sigma factor (sigma-70 family)
VRINDGTPVAELVAAAIAGDERAWDRIVERYLPLVFSVLRPFRLPSSDAQDVSQTLWLRLIEHLEGLLDPRALPGWIAVTTRKEAIRMVRLRGRTVQVDPMESQVLDDRSDVPQVEDQLLRSERRQMLRDGLAELPVKQQELLLLLTADPPISYLEISRRLNIPVGSIGPTRARCLARLRATTAMREYFPSDGVSTRVGESA